MDGGGGGRKRALWTKDRGGKFLHLPSLLVPDLVFLEPRLVIKLRARSKLIHVEEFDRLVREGKTHVLFPKK